MPPIGLRLSGLDFSHLEWVLKPDNPLTKADELVAIRYGAFINTSIKFMIVASFFMHLKFDNKILRRLFITGITLALFCYLIVLLMFRDFGDKQDVQQVKLQPSGIIQS